MIKKVSITSGAGFIGSDSDDKLIEEKQYEVTVFDTLEEKIHGKK